MIIIYLGIIALIIAFFGLAWIICYAASYSEKWDELYQDSIINNTISKDEISDDLSELCSFEIKADGTTEVTYPSIYKKKINDLLNIFI